MIKINLLPAEMRPVKKSATSHAFMAGSQTRLIAGGVGAVCFLLFLCTAYFDFAYYADSKKFKRVSDELAAIQPGTQALRDLEQELNGVLVPQRDFLKTYILNKTPITSVLQGVSEALPDGVWLQSFSISNSGKQRSFQIQGAAIQFKGKTSIEQIEAYLQALTKVVPGAVFNYSTSKQVVNKQAATAFNVTYQWQADL